MLIICQICDEEFGTLKITFGDVYEENIEIICRHCLFMMYELHCRLGLASAKAQELYPYYTCSEHTGSNNRKFDKKIIGELMPTDLSDFDRTGEIISSDWGSKDSPTEQKDQNEQ